MKKKTYQLVYKVNTGAGEAEAVVRMINKLPADIPVKITLTPGTTQIPEHKGHRFTTSKMRPCTIIDAEWEE
jgi:hypothetical protein